MDGNTQEGRHEDFFFVYPLEKYIVNKCLYSAFVKLLNQFYYIMFKISLYYKTFNYNATQYNNIPEMYGKYMYYILKKKSKI